MIKRSITIQGHRTSISLEQPFWDCLGEIAATQNISISALVATIDKTRTITGHAMTASHTKTAGGLSSVIRVYILNWARSQHRK